MNKQKLIKFLRTNLKISYDGNNWLNLFIEDEKGEWLEIHSTYMPKPEFDRYGNFIDNR